MGDRTSMIEASLLSYYDHPRDTEYAAKVFTLASQQEVAANINTLVRREAEYHYQIQQYYFEINSLSEAERQKNARS